MQSFEEIVNREVDLTFDEDMSVSARKARIKQIFRFVKFKMREEALKEAVSAVQSIKLETPIV